MTHAFPKPFIQSYSNFSEADNFKTALTIFIGIHCSKIVHDQACMPCFIQRSDWSPAANLSWSLLCLFNTYAYLSSIITGYHVVLIKATISLELNNRK